MEKARFLEAKKQMEIIDACEMILINEEPYIFPVDDVVKVVFSDKQVTRSFIRLVENEKAIAEQKFNEI